jgi:hypothetical protein
MCSCDQNKEKKAATLCSKTRHDESVRSCRMDVLGTNDVKNELLSYWGVDDHPVCQHS